MIFEYERTNIHYQLKGKGPCIVMLHGFLEDHQIWEGITDRLIERFTLLMPDLPGHGRSDVMGEVHSMKDMALAIQALTEHLNIDSYQILGHSMGGYVSLALLENHADSVDRIMLLNSTPEADSDMRKENRNRGIELLYRNPSTFISSLIRQLFDPETVQLYEEEISQLVTRATSFPLEGIAACMRGMRDRPDRTSLLSAFTGRKLFLSATHDPIIELTQIEQLANQTESDFFALQGGHMSWLESTAEIVKIV
ncbi:alpha/beta fold hydrolase [Aureitalea marina]|uniref:AB hydrolase-1 domain-containing protein n=1 Tax=Aureitalea marina TaxID=930804 RepID=A0A2S7KSS8_9FLAO|nr:alpha/beta hydrolase [Aureitalea marina]PQB05638.1 hypothetical protein BST85_12570 [Aureitalea marina]